jgi:hypothetical protein
MNERMENEWKTNGKRMENEWKTNGKRMENEWKTNGRGRGCGARVQQTRMNT